MYLPSKSILIRLLLLSFHISNALSQKWSNQAVVVMFGIPDAHIYTHDIQTYTKCLTSPFKHPWRYWCWTFNQCFPMLALTRASPSSRGSNPKSNIWHLVHWSRTYFQALYVTFIEKNLRKHLPAQTQRQ